MRVCARRNRFGAFHLARVNFALDARSSLHTEDQQDSAAL